MPRKQRQRAKALRADAHTQPSATALPEMQLRPWDCSENKDKQDRHVPWAAQERNYFPQCMADKRSLRNRRPCALVRCDRPSRWYPHRPDRPDPGPRLCFGRRECRECIRNRISIRRRQKSRHRRCRCYGSDNHAARLLISEIHSLVPVRSPEMFRVSRVRRSRASSPR